MSKICQEEERTSFSFLVLPGARDPSYATAVRHADVVTMTNAFNNISKLACQNLRTQYWPDILPKYVKMFSETNLYNYSELRYLQ